jgi:hypothetical protein
MQLLSKQMAHSYHWAISVNYISRWWCIGEWRHGSMRYWSRWVVSVTPRPLYPPTHWVGPRAGLDVTRWADYGRRLPRSDTGHQQTTPTWDPRGPAPSWHCVCVCVCVAGVGCRSNTETYQPWAEGRPVRPRQEETAVGRHDTYSTRPFQSAPANTQRSCA